MLLVLGFVFAIVSIAVFMYVSDKKSKEKLLSDPRMKGANLLFNNSVKLAIAENGYIGIVQGLIMEVFHIKEVISFSVSKKEKGGKVEKVLLEFSLNNKKSSFAIFDNGTYSIGAENNEKRINELLSELERIKKKFESADIPNIDTSDDLFEVKSSSNKIAYIIAVVSLLISAGFFYFGNEQIQKEKIAKKNCPEYQMEQMKKQVKRQFSPINNSHIELTNWIKSTMRDPKSYEHIQTQTRFYPPKSDINKKGFVYVITTIRGNNALGGKVICEYEAEYNLDGSVRTPPRQFNCR